MMMRTTKRNLLIHLCLSLLIAAFLVLSIFIAAARGEGAGAGAPGAETPGAEITQDPLHRLPSTPEEAHRRLEERSVSWPEATGGGDFSAASVVNNTVRVSIPYDTVEGFISNPGENVQVDLYDSTWGLKQTTTVASDDGGWFKADMSAGDIASGDRVYVTDLKDNDTVAIFCTLTGTMDFAHDRVTGGTIANNTVDVYIVAPSTYYADVPPGAAHVQTTADGSGNYTANISGLDLKAGDAALIFSTDANGHKVMNVAYGSGTGLVVYPQFDDVLGYHVAGTSLTVNINGGAQSRTVGTLGDGFFEAWFSDYNIKDGDTVSCNMGTARSITVRDVTARCDPSTNTVSGTAPANRKLRITMDPYSYGPGPVIYETTSDASGNFSVNLGSRFTATGTEVFNVCWYDDEEDAVVYEFQTFSWYLAEGYTGGGFDTWVVIQNPGADDASVVLTFQLKGGGTAPSLPMTVGAGKRASVLVDSLTGLSNAEVSTKVTSISGNWIMAERAMYFNYGGKRGGHNSIGTLTPSTTWYLAEGYTRGTDFDTWVVIQNPGTTDAVVTLSFQLKGGGTAAPVTLPVGAGKRESVWLDALPGLSNAEVATKVTSTNGVPVVAERAVYFSYGGKVEGHESIGVTEPATTWYIAEGYTGGDFDTWVVIQNPGTTDAVVTLSFQLKGGGTAAPVTLPVGAGKRESVWLDALPGLSNAEVATKVTSTNGVPVVVERIVYFNYKGIAGGHCSIATDNPSTTWYLAEGYTGGDFDTWVVIQNPGTTDAVVTLSFQLAGGGTAAPVTLPVGAGKRESVWLDALPGLSNAEVATKVTSTNGVPVVVERAEYFRYQGLAGGHSSIAVPGLME